MSARVFLFRDYTSTFGHVSSLSVLYCFVFSIDSLLVLMAFLLVRKKRKTMKNVVASLMLLSSSSAVTVASFPRMIHSAKSQLQKRPALSHGIVGFVLFGASDILAQQLEASQNLANEKTKSTFLSQGLSMGKTLKKEKEKSKLSFQGFSMEHFDLIRFLSAGVIGACLSGYVYPFAYKNLDRIWKGKDLLSISKKSVIEVFTVGIFANSLSMGASGILVAKNPNQVVSHVKEEIPEVTHNDLKVWFPYNMIAFGMIPVYIRPVTTSLMECLWQTYISLVSNDGYPNNPTHATVMR